MTDTVCFWCETDCGATCLGLTRSRQMRPDDPAYALLTTEQTSTPVLFRAGCYICEDPEYAQMGMPLCRPCPSCTGGHIPADDIICDDCGASDEPDGPDYQPEPVVATPAPFTGGATLTTFAVPLHVALARLRTVIKEEERKWT